jgi:hypothetical protein
MKYILILMFLTAAVSMETVWFTNGESNYKIVLQNDEIPVFDQIVPCGAMLTSEVEDFWKVVYNTKDIDEIFYIRINSTNNYLFEKCIVDNINESEIDVLPIVVISLLSVLVFLQICAITVCIFRR